MTVAKIVCSITGNMTGDNIKCLYINYEFNFLKPYVRFDMRILLLKKCCTYEYYFKRYKLTRTLFSINSVFGRYFYYF